MPQTRRIAAQTVCRFSHNADFCQLRISKYPANAPKTNYFSALGIERRKLFWEGDVLDNWGVLEKGEKWYNGKRICSQVRGTKIIREVLIYEYFEYRACF